MSRTLLRRAAFLLVAVAFTGCRDQAPDPLAPGAISLTHLPSDAAIKTLINQVFGPTANSTTVHWKKVVTALEAGNTADARDKLLKVADFIRSHTHLITPPANETQQQVAIRLINLMVSYAFGSSAMGSDAVIAIVSPGTLTVVRTPDNRAAIELPAGALSQPTVLLIYRDPVQTRAACAGPLVTTLCQYPLFYHFDPYPHTRLNVPARVGVCLVNSGPGAAPEETHDRLRLAHDKPADPAGYVPGGTVTEGIEILPYVYVGDFLTCGTTTVASAVTKAPAGNSLADRGVRVLNRLASAAMAFASPTTAHAIDQGGGGFLLDFSNFNVVDPGPGEEEEEEAPPADLSPPVVTANVSGTLSSTGWYTSNVDVSWSVTDNESTVTHACASSSVTTDTPEQIFSCTATSAGGTTNESVTIKRDASSPVITPTVTGTPGDNGWYISNVSVSWAVTDATSGVNVGSKEGCADAAVTSDTDGVTFSCSALDNASNSGTNSVTVKRDASPPVITATVTGPEGNGGWYTGDVNVSWSVTDPTSGVDSQSGCSVASVTSDTPGVTFTCSAENGAGLSNSRNTIVKRDATKPVIAYTGNAGTYTVDQTIAITCTASDAMSGLAPGTSCENVSGEAYTFGLGTHTFSAAASDNAGNSNTASTSFLVRVTPTSLCTLTRRFSSSAGIGNSLCAKLSAYAASIARGSSVSAAGQLGAYINEVRAQSGKAIAPDKANILIGFAYAL